MFDRIRTTLRGAASTARSHIAELILSLGAMGIAVFLVDLLDAPPTISIMVAVGIGSYIGFRFRQSRRQASEN